MSIWVRSQNKRRLICCDGFIVNKESCVLGFQGSNDEGVVLGKYDTEERALEIINFIHKFITKGVASDYILRGVKTQGLEVFIMPEK